MYIEHGVLLRLFLKNWMLILVLLCENERQRWDASRYIKAKRSAFMYIVTRLISDVYFHITGPKLTIKLTIKTYNYRHCDTSMSPKTVDYFPSGGVIATLLGNCKVLCYANMNVTLFRVSANQISVFSITQQSRLFYYKKYDNLGTLFIIKNKFQKDNVNKKAREKNLSQR